MTAATPAAALCRKVHHVPAIVQREVYELAGGPEQCDSVGAAGT
jgi:hypothetical protein